MISYELAKQLKDAGFPQHFEEDVICGICGATRSCTKCINHVYTPPLSELIEACKGEQVVLIDGEKVKMAIGSKSGFICSTGALDESLAHLYLKINTKEEYE